jgi:hypothetical protein
VTCGSFPSARITAPDEAPHDSSAWSTLSEDSVPLLVKMSQLESQERMARLQLVVNRRHMWATPT